MPTLPLHPQTLPLLASGRPILVGLSGGRDSIALLSSLLSLEGCRPVGCHVHHGIRGKEADRDADFSRTFCERAGIPFLIKRMDVPAEACLRGISIEEAARIVRRQCFSDWASTHSDAVIAFAHHMNDQAETVLFQLCRGCSGLGGIKPVATLENGSLIVRPLLGCSRTQITDYLSDQGIDWIDDSTNDAVDCARNAIRHEILPHLSSIMKRDVSPIIARAANLSTETETALDQAISQLEIIDPQGRLFLPKVNAMPEELQKAAVFRFLRQSGIPDLSERCVKQVLGILSANAPARTMLPGEWTASRKEKRLRLLPPTSNSQPENDQ